MGLYLFVLCSLLLGAALTGTWLLPRYWSRHEARLRRQLRTQIRQELKSPRQFTKKPDTTRPRGTVYNTLSLTTVRAELAQLAQAAARLRAAVAQILDNSGQSPTWPLMDYTAKLPEPIALSTKRRKKLRRLQRPAVTY